jgi:uncharacterized protein YxeA
MNILIIIIICFLIFRAKQHIEKFDVNMTQSYLKTPTSNFQINQTHMPSYNWPKYIGKYPYYRYMFNHPYNSSIYYS